MSLECGECERDLRGPHAPSCSQYKPPARCGICDKLLVEDDFGLYCPTHGASSAEADPYAAMSQHPHGNGTFDAFSSRAVEQHWQRNGPLFAQQSTDDNAWRTRALEAEAEVERLRAALAEAERQLGGWCDATGDQHVAIKQGSYSFCAECGESLRRTVYIHAPRATHNFGDDA